MKLRRIGWLFKTVLNTLTMAMGIFLALGLHRLKVTRISKWVLALPVSWVIGGFWGICSSTRRLAQRMEQQWQKQRHPAAGKGGKVALPF